MKDELFLTICNRLYNKIKQRKGKEMDAIKVIRADLRRLGNLYRIFIQHSPQSKHGSVLDMFERANKKVLGNAIINC